MWCSFDTARLYRLETVWEQERCPVALHTRWVKGHWLSDQSWPFAFSYASSYERAEEIRLSHKLLPTCHLLYIKQPCQKPWQDLGIFKKVLFTSIPDITVLVISITASSIYWSTSTKSKRNRESRKEIHILCKFLRF